MPPTCTLIIGASVAGLAAAASLQKQGIDYKIIEKEAEVAMPWRRHYQRLHLHTNKSLSHLPYKKFGPGTPRYPSRQQVIDYLVDYQKAFNIQPVFNTEAITVQKEGAWWVTTTNTSVFTSKYIIVATGAFGKSKPINFKGMETFAGSMLHSSQYNSGKDFKGQKVLVVGFGNSACEIAIDLYEQGAKPAMSVRSAVNVLPRDILGIPVLQLSIPMRFLPPKLADKINAPLMQLLVGNLAKLGLRKLPYGPLEQIQKDGTVPVLDIGTLQHIRKGHIKMYGEIDRIDQQTVYFTSGASAGFDAIVAAIGYYRDYAAVIRVGQERFNDLKVSTSKQQYFGKDGLYFCGFWIAPTGQFREIGLDAKKIAADILQKEQANR